MFFKLPVLLLTVLSAALGAVAADDSANAMTKPNWSGTIKTLSGGLSGTVRVTSPTSLIVEDYKFGDASAPALYWWGSTGKSIQSGFRISNTRISKTSTGGTLMITLDAGKTVADFTTVGLWCETFGIDFGEATLMPSNGDLSMTASSTESSTASMTAVAGSGASLMGTISVRLSLAGAMVGMAALFF